jgi:hypothetical protein
MPHPTNADIIRRAHRLLGTVSGGQEPTGSMASDSMERLQSVILDQPGLLLRSLWKSKDVDADYTAREGQRISVTAGQVTLPTEITPVGGGTRAPLNFARVQIIGASATNVGLWVYVASLGEWRQVDELTAGGEFPFGIEDVDGMAAQLCVALQDEYGGSFQAGPRTVAKAAQSVTAFRSRYLKAQPTDWTRPNDCPPSDCTFPDYC